MFDEFFSCFRCSPDRFVTWAGLAEAEIKRCTRSVLHLRLLPWGLALKEQMTTGEIPFALFVRLLRRKRTNDFLKARIAPERIPEGQ
jgi:hypothetical protein